MKKVTIIKYGTNVLMDKDRFGHYCIDYGVMADHGEIISKNDGAIIIVSSGAVGFGRSITDLSYINDEIIKKRALASVGNPHLSIGWDRAIASKDVLQVLVTHRELQNDNCRVDLKKIISAIYQSKNKAIIQFNENDFLSDEELREIRGGDFGDNDQTAALITQLCAEIFDEVELIINTSSDGVVGLDGKKIDNLSIIDLTDENINNLCGENKTESGTGGMKNKLITIRNLLKENNKIKSWIINGKDANQLNSVLQGEDKGTKITK